VSFLIRIIRVGIVLFLALAHAHALLDSQSIDDLRFSGIASSIDSSYL
jgi:hypothetical protein